MPVPLLATNLYIPPPREHGVSRPRLIEKLLSSKNRSGGLILLSGPAGFGKTTLLSDFAARLERRVAWLSLDDGDNDPIRFWTYLIAALQTVSNGIGEELLAMLGSPQPPPEAAIPTLLINELAAQDQNITLVLDDYHAIQTPSIHNGVVFLLEHVPEKFHIVISTRIDPPWPLARYRARNQLIEIRAKDLRFSAEEAAQFLNQTMGLELSTQDVEALETRTEGWAAGLQLAALSMQGRSDTAAFVQAFTGSNLYVAEYLLEEVLQRQSAQVQEFLLQTSILERLNGDLCEAVTGRSGAQTTLLDLQRANLFVIPLDDEGRWFRYHQLFADLLKARLRQNRPVDGVAELHRRAAAWFEQVGMAPEAIEHARAAADLALLVRLVEKSALPMILQAHVRTVEEWLQAIPPDLASQSARINMAFAWLNILRGTIPQAAPYLEQLRVIFSAPGIADKDPSLQGEWLAIQSNLLNIQGKPEESRDLSNQALTLLSDEDASVRSMVLVNLATAYQQMLDYDHAAETFQMIAREAQAAGDRGLETIALSGQAQMLLQRGRLRRAFEIASDAISRIEADGKITPFAATFYGEIGVINYYWHRIERSKQYLLKSAQISGRSGYSDPEIFFHLILSVIAQMQGDWKSADQEMTIASDLARKIPPAMIREQIISQQVRVDLAFDRISAVKELLKPEGFEFEDDFIFPKLATGSIVTQSVGLLYNSALRAILYIYKGRDRWSELSRGAELAGIVLAGELQCGHIPIATETLLLRSQIYAALNDEPNSLADVKQALELAEPEGFISPFVEEGLPIAGALVKLAERKMLGNVAQGYLEDILAAFPRIPRFVDAGIGKMLRAQTAGAATVLVDEDGLPLEPLTARELEVLRLVAAGDSNHSIAEKLVITVSAVKKHTANIYGKLGVNSRTQAAARAHQLGLLPLES